MGIRPASLEPLALSASGHERMVGGRAAASGEIRMDLSEEITWFGNILHFGDILKRRTARRDRVPFGLSQFGCRWMAVASGEGSAHDLTPLVGYEAKEQWPVASAQWPVNAKRGRSRGDRKAPERSQFARVLVVDRAKLTTNQGGIGQAERTQFPAARDLEGRLNSALLGLFSTSCGPSFSVHGYPTQCAANTCCPRSGRFVCLNSAFSRHFKTTRQVDRERAVGRATISGDFLPGGRVVRITSRSKQKAMPSQRVRKARTPRPDTSSCSTLQPARSKPSARKAAVRGSTVVLCRRYSESCSSVSIALVLSNRIALRVLLAQESPAHAL